MLQNLTKSVFLNLNERDGFYIFERRKYKIDENTRISVRKLLQTKEIRNKSVLQVLEFTVQCLWISIWFNLFFTSMFLF